MTTEELGNQHGYQCPTCKSGENLHIQATVNVEARLYPDGVDHDGGDTEWTDLSDVRCSGCSWSGLVRDLLTVELAD